MLSHHSDFEQESKMIRFILFLKDHCGCCGENRLYGARVETRRQLEDFPGGPVTKTVIS